MSNLRSKIRPLLCVASFALLAPLLIPSETVIAAPSWWSGDCNVDNHTGSAPLGASFNQVKACGPGSFLQGGYDSVVHFAPGLWGEYEWQCVELVMRYMYLIYNINPYNSPGGKDVVNNYTGTRLNKITNNGLSLPTPGDILAHNGGQYGHTSIVTLVTVNSTGTGVITVMEQNGTATSNGFRDISVINKIIGDNVTGWLHDPNYQPPYSSVDTSSNSATVYKQADGFTQVFTQGANNSLRNYYNNYGQPWYSGAVGGNSSTYSQPTAVYNQSSGFTQVFARGPNNSLVSYWNFYGQPWYSSVIGGVGTTYSAPTAVYNQTNGFTQVFAQGPNNTLVSYWNNYGQPWYTSTVGGNGSTYSAPSAVYKQSDGFTQVFAQGANNSLVSYWNDYGQPWYSSTIGGSNTTYSAPAAVYNQSNTFTQVFTQGPGNSLLTYWDVYGQPWGSGAITGTGTTYSSPSVAYSQDTASNGFTQVFAQGSSNSIASYWGTYGQPWSSGNVSGSNTAYSTPIVAFNQGNNFRQVFVQGPNNSLSNYWGVFGQPWNSGVVAGSGTTF